jgi:hypothetical protein
LTKNPGSKFPSNILGAMFDSCQLPAEPEDMDRRNRPGIQTRLFRVDHGFHGTGQGTGYGYLIRHLCVLAAAPALPWRITVLPIVSRRGRASWKSASAPRP